MEEVKQKISEMSNFISVKNNLFWKIWFMSATTD